jgi:hypothetical protein
MFFIEVFQYMIVTEVYLGHLNSLVSPKKEVKASSICLQIIWEVEFPWVIRWQMEHKPIRHIKDSHYASVFLFF